MVADGADDLRREGVAEGVDAEEIDGDCRGAYGSLDRVDDGGIERASIQKDEELGAKERGNGG